MGLEFNIRESNEVRIHDEKERWAEEFTMRKSDGVRLHHKKERLGESSP